MHHALQAIAGGPTTRLLIRATAGSLAAGAVASKQTVLPRGGFATQQCTRWLRDDATVDWLPAGDIGSGLRAGSASTSRATAQGALAAADTNCALRQPARAPVSDGGEPPGGTVSVLRSLDEHRVQKQFPKAGFGGVRRGVKARLPSARDDVRYYYPVVHPEKAPRRCSTASLCPRNCRRAIRPWRRLLPWRGWHLHVVQYRAGCSAPARTIVAGYLAQLAVM